MEFADSGTQDVYEGNDTRAARKACPTTLLVVAGRELDMLVAAASLRDLASPPGNKLEALQGDREGQHSIRINDQYRICFRWTENGPTEVEIVDYH
jgi:proteic killer suppression protein